MAKNKVDPCMFCGKAPCGCNQPAKKVNTKPATKKSATPPENPTAVSTESGPVKPDLRAAMKSRTPLPKPAKARPAALKTQPVDETVDEELERALIVLAPILHPHEYRRFPNILIDPAKRAASWKRRNKT